MFEANKIALFTLQPGQSFFGISSIINPDHWDYDANLAEYKNMNYAQAEKGVNIARVFLLKDESELETMTPIIEEQARNKIDVSYIYCSRLADFSFYPDFTILPDHKFALYVPKIDKLLTVIATRNDELISDMTADFRKIQARSERL